MCMVEVVIPVKSFLIAKSRLADLPDRPSLSRAMLLDTLTAVGPVADRILLVSDEPTLGTLIAEIDGAVEVLADPGSGLNHAIVAGDQHLGEVRPGALRIAMVADLPTLRPADLAEVVAAGRTHRSSVVVDADGVGTTMLLSSQGSLRPRFGVGSAAAHVQDGAVALSGVDQRVRRDVDTPQALVEAIGIGVGPHTSTVVARETMRARLEVSRALMG